MRHRHRRHRGLRSYISSSAHFQDENQMLMVVWVLRFLLHAQWAFRCFYIEHKGFADEDVQNFLMLQDVNEDEVSEKELKQLMQAQLVQYEQSLSHQTSNLHKNIKLLTNRITLDSLQQEILQYAVLVEDCSIWRDLFRNMGIKTERQFQQVLAFMLDTSSMHIKEATSGRSSLRKSGLIRMNKDMYDECKFELLDGLEETLLREHSNEKDLLSCFLLPASETTLELQDYAHIQDEMTVLSHILESSLKQRDCGVNILLYGTAGSGKTELSRLLAKELNLSLFEVKTSDDDGDPLRPSHRLSNYCLCQQLLSDDSSSILLFDEVEDVFPAHSFSLFGHEVKSGENKGWMNKLLEENKTPAIWICNQVQQIDAAFLRRFDYVMELDTPPKSVRFKMIERYFGHITMNDAYKDKLASHDQLSPAQIAKASRVVGRLNDADIDIEVVLDKMLGNTLKAMGKKALPQVQKHDTHYDLSLLNTSTDMDALLCGLQRMGSGNLCFYGAPGTGKTALAGYIAKQLDKPLLAKKASDILSMYVGQSEKNIAAMFEEARQKNAVLVLDEADSLLRDRRNAQRSWEVTQVNELLVQMERFEGIFICSTNLMDDLDQASLRRFAMKIQFDYLKPEQVCRMLEQECVGGLSDKNRMDVMQMNQLAPGDFSAVKKRLRLLGVASTAEMMIRELKEEVRVKNLDTSNPIGFGV